MLRTTQRSLISLLHRRKWEQRVAAALAERTDVEKNNAAKRFERIYEKKQFTRVEEAFPLEHAHLQQNSREHDAAWRGARPALRETAEAFPSHHGLPSAFPNNRYRPTPSSSTSSSSPSSQHGEQEELKKHNDRQQQQVQRDGKEEEGAPLRFEIPSFEQLTATQRQQKQQEERRLSHAANEQQDATDDATVRLLSSINSSSSSSSFSAHLHPHIASVAFLGPQNSGKSSLINALSHRHTNIESNRAGTTKQNQCSFFTVHDTQITLMDTPGLVIPQHIHKIEHRQQQQGAGGGSASVFYKDRRRNAADALEAWESLHVNDVVALTLPVGTGGFLDSEFRSIAREVVRRASKRELPVVLVFTKMDLVQTRRQKELYTAFRTDVERLALPVAACFETSVVEGTGLVDLKDFLRGYGKPGVWTRAKIEHSELTPSQHVSALLQQTLFDLLPHEIPHELKHRVIGWTKRESGGGVEIVIELFFHRPTYLFTFYGKLEAISMAVQRLVEREMQMKVFVVFQAFLTPGGVSKNAK